MSEVDKYRLRILKTYSIMVEYKGTPHRSKVPTGVEDETFKKWKNRVLGPNVSDVVVLAPWEPAPQTKMRTIQELSNLQWPKLIATEVATKKDQERKRTVSEEVDKVRKSYSKFSADTLKDLVLAMESDLHPAAKEFLSEKLASESSLDTTRLVTALIRAYNDALCLLRAQASGVAPHGE